MPTLHWLNKEEAIKKTQSVPFRLLESEPEMSYGDPNAQNMLICGDILTTVIKYVFDIFPEIMYIPIYKT